MEMGNHMNKFKNPKISIVLPTYNGEKWLKLSIESVLSQTEQNWELIIVDNCSIDNTLKIASTYAAQNNRIKVISNPINKRLPASLNIGFSYATGKYLTWTSDDNMYKPKALATLSEYLDTHHNVDMVSMNQDVIDESGKFIKDMDNEYRYQRCAAALMHNCNVGAAFMYRKSIADKIGGYDENTFCAEDYDYWCRIALAGNLEYTADNIYQYRISSVSLTATKRDLVAEKTAFVKLKYADAFFKKFNFTNLDKALFFCTFEQI